VHPAAVRLYLLGLLSAALLITSPAARSAPEGSGAARLGAGDSIRAEVRGRLRALAGTAGQSSRFQVTTDAGVWELDLSGDTALSQAAQRLEGKPIVAAGTYAQRSDTAGVRRVIVAETLEADAGKGRGERIDVTVQGTLKTGVMAIGAETTGVTLTANGVVWELELQGKQLETAGHLNGSKVRVAGRLTRPHGVEIRNRIVVKVRSIKAAH
jgi:hypothetical protein